MSDFQSQAHPEPSKSASLPAASPAVSEDFVSFYTSVQSTVRDNIATLIERSASKEEKAKFLQYIDALQRFRFKPAPEGDLIYETRTVLLKFTEFKENSKIVAGVLMLQAAAVYAAFSNREFAELSAIEKKIFKDEALQQVKDLLPRLIGAGQKAYFTLAQEHPKNPFEDMILEYLTPTEEEREKIDNATAFGRASGLSDYQKRFEAGFVQASVSEKLKFLKTLYKEVLNQEGKIEAFGSSWTLFAAEFNVALANKDYEERPKLLKSHISDVINTIAAVYILDPKRKGYSAGALAAPDDLKKIIEVVVESFRAFILSKNHAMDINFVHKELTEASQKISSNPDLYSFIRQGDPAKAIAAGIAKMAISENEVKRYQEEQARLGMDVTLKRNAMLLEVAKRTDNKAALPVTTRLSLEAPKKNKEIFHSPEGSSAYSGMGLGAYFNIDNGYAGSAELRAHISSTLKNEEFDSLFFAFPDSVMQSMKRAFFTEPHDRPAKAALWIKHLLAIYDMQDPDPKARKAYPAISDAWTANGTAAGLFSKKQLSNYKSLCEQLPDTKQPTRDEINRATFLAVLFAALARYEPRSNESIAEKLKDSFEELSANSAISPVIAVLTKGLYAAYDGHFPEVPLAPVAEPKKVSFLDKVLHRGPGEAILLEPVKPSFDSFFGSLGVFTRATHFEGVINRICDIGPAIEAKFKEFRYDEQMKLARFLMSGADDQALVKKHYSSLSNLTHPDELKKKWPDEKLHPPALAIFKAVTTIFRMSDELDKFSGESLFEAIKNLNTAAIEFEAKYQEFKRRHDETKERKQDEQATSIGLVLEEIVKLNSGVEAMSAQHRDLSNAQIKLLNEIIDIQKAKNEQ